MSDIDYGLPEYEQIKDVKKDATNPKIRPRDFVINTISSVLIMLVMALLNGFVDGAFEFKLIFNWGFGVLLVANWIGGISFSYTMRKNGIGLGMCQKEYIAAESEKQAAFAKVKDYTESQKLLNQKMDADFEYRRAVLEANIAKLIQHKMPKGETWKQGTPLPNKTRLKIKYMAFVLEHMEPAQIDLMSLAENETSSIPKSMFYIQADPTKTGGKWFAKKGFSKILWYSVTPILLSILSGAISGGAAFKSFLMISGTLAFMLFNGVYAFGSAYDAVTRKGVGRLHRITQIVNMINK